MLANTYRWLARALMVAALSTWTVARTWLWDGLFPQWHVWSPVLWVLAAAIVIMAWRRPGLHATALLLSAALGGAATELALLSTWHVNATAVCLSLGLAYAALALMRARGWGPAQTVWDAALAALLGLLGMGASALWVEGTPDALYGAWALALAVVAGAHAVWLREPRGTWAPWLGVAALGVLATTAAMLVPTVAIRDTAQPALARLTPEQYRCTQNGDTEQPFANAYWNNKAPGIYADLLSGEALFSSLDKYDSGSGWPSFTQPLSHGLQLRDDRSLGVLRTEVRSGSAHLGHVFDDGPGPDGKRFCINSAALRFVPLADMKKQGYGAYLFAFAPSQGWQVATFAGGCFWGMQPMFDQAPGVVETQVGYADHAEAVQILFDPHKTSYTALVELFFRVHDPTTLNRQGNDVGSQYRSAIFYADSSQQAAAAQVKQRVAASHAWGHAPITTQVTALHDFARAEDGDQRYLDKHPNAYTCHFERHLDFSAP